MDGTHIRTNIKSKLIRCGLQDIKLSAWKNVAFSKKTNLSIAMLTVQEDGKLVHQQSDSFVPTMFSVEVGKEMRSNGATNEADFCKLFREWHEADDSPGIPSFERCRRSLNFRNWLLKGYIFSNFPPPSAYVLGIPRVTFEGLVYSIDAHLLLYGLVKGGTYNWRSVSTLVAENFMGELAEQAQGNIGVPDGRMLKRDIGKISQLHAMRMKPDRKFQMQTSRGRSYEQQETLATVAEQDQERNAGCTYIETITIRDHIFDVIGQKPGKQGKIAGLYDLPRGARPVRHHYRIDESRILPSLRLGLTNEQFQE